MKADMVRIRCQTTRRSRGVWLNRRAGTKWSVRGGRRRVFEVGDLAGSEQVIITRKVDGSGMPGLFQAILLDFDRYLAQKSDQ